MKSFVEILLQFAQLLDGMSVPYMVVGSVASSLYGDSRATADVDIVADLRTEKVSPLVAALQEDFYVDAGAIHRAVQSRRSFNAIHFDSLFKVDVYVLPAEAFAQQQMERRRLEKLFPDSVREIYLASPEDTVQSKLRWHRRGGETSARQLTDVLGIIRIQGERLDIAYLREWADKLNVRDLLDKAFKDAC
ncbi:MAG TPA: hypothetical protein VM943_03800 [Pyrinomonadaceae bacterium]|nr:hypothetical protein [Pyrinomonadaceae bacterium]